jgi:ribonucleoside-triphosphate reductase
MEAREQMFKEKGIKGLFTDLSLNVDCIDTFMELLDKKIFEAKDMLIERFEWICSQSPDSAKFM